MNQSPENECECSEQERDDKAAGLSQAQGPATGG